MEKADGIGNSPNGSSGQIQYNDGGSFGGGTNFVWDDINNRLGIGTTTPWGQLSVNPNGISGPSFAIGSSTATHFVVSNGGKVGIGIDNTNQLLNVGGNIALAASGYITSYADNLSYFMPYETATGQNGISHGRRRSDEYFVFKRQRRHRHHIAIRDA